MKIAISYLGIAAIGYLIAVFLKEQKNRFGWIGKFLPMVVTALIFTMGFRIGENAEVVSNIGTIGIQSLIMALVTMVFTIVALGLVRRALGYNRYGHFEEEEDADEGRGTDPEKKRTSQLQP